MTFDVHEFGFAYKFCRRHRQAQKQQRWLQLFPPGGPFEIVAIAIMGPLTKIKQQNEFISKMTDLNGLLTRNIPVAKTAAPDIATVDFKN